MQTALTIAQIISILAAAIGLPAILQHNLARRNKADDEEKAHKATLEAEEKARQERRAEDRRTESLLVLEGIGKVGCLARATGIAVRDKRINGEMTDALEAYDEYDDKLADFLRAQAVIKNH